MTKEKTMMMVLAIAGYGIAFAQLPKDGKSDKKVASHTFEATFTKWVTKAPQMAGVVGGDVGVGTYSGEILKMNTVGDITKIEALYKFNGGIHTFTAHVYVTENDAPGVGTATITGRVEEGWMKGATVTGEYKVWATCPIPTPGNGDGNKCYQGTLHIPKGDGNWGINKLGFTSAPS
jgi:hypothetical protein